MTELTSNSIHPGDKGSILTILYSNTSAFSEMLVDSDLNNFQPELRTISFRNPPTIPDPNPKCGKSDYCVKAKDCQGGNNCICVADKWNGEYFSSKCTWPYPGYRLFPGLRDGRGALESDSANINRPDPSMNSTIMETGTMDLACPCNCTYVSKACCNSPFGLVYETPDLRLGSVQAPSANLTCNATTGDFQASNETLNVLLTPRELFRKRSGQMNWAL